MAPSFEQLFFLLPMVSWIVALVGGIGMLRHRDGTHPWTWYAWNGWSFWVGKGFAPGAAKWRRLLLAGGIGFALTIVGMMILAVVGSDDGGLR